MSSILSATPPNEIIARLVDDLDLSIDDLSQTLRVGGAAVERWQQGSTPQKFWTRVGLANLERLHDELLQTFDVEGVRQWMDTPQPPLYGYTPRQALRKGPDNVARVRAALAAELAG